MKAQKTILLLFGTRPEFLKVLPVLKGLSKKEKYVVKTCFTGQHREMVLDLIKEFNVDIDFEFDLMLENQKLEDFLSSSLKAVCRIINENIIDGVIVQGDTSTSLAGCLAAFYYRIPLFHIEAGLRTYNLFSPFPEEFNRQIISKYAKLHFCPTESAVQALRHENVFEGVFNTGNTIIDTLKLLTSENNLSSEYLELFNSLNNKKYIMITAHRRENFDGGIQSICDAIKKLAHIHSDFTFLFSVHLNPNVNIVVRKSLECISNIKLTSPIPYSTFIQFLKKSYLVITDSGGIQEEVAEFRIPVVITRDNTERMEIVDVGGGVLVGSDSEKIVSIVSELISNKNTYESMREYINPFGNGTASKQIIDQINNYLISII